MFFASYNPSAALAPYIRSYWILERNDVPTIAETILPDGCMELIFHYGDEYVSNIAEQQTTQSAPVVIGQIKKAITIQPGGQTGIFSVRFHPWGFTALSGIPANELTEQVVEAEHIWGKEIISIKEQLAQADAHKKLKIVEQFLLRILNTRTPGKLAKTNTIAPVLGYMQQHKGNVAVAHLAYQCNMSVRNFNRTVSDATGLSPKLLARITRLQAFLNTHTNNATFTDSLYKCGYYDQAHFIREFKEIANATPHSFFSNDNVMAELMWQ